MQKSPIEWTDYTSNPIKFRDASGKIVWGCVHASEGCTHCYAEALAHRYDKGGPFTAPTMQGLTPFVDEAELRSILRSKAPAGSKVFLGDMSDIFGPWVTDEMLDRVFAVMALRPDLTFQLLTKRPERMRAYVSATDGVWDAARLLRDAHLDRNRVIDFKWPLPNVWLGTSAENQHWADIRIPELLATPAAVRFVSYEPALGPLNLMPVFIDGDSGTRGFDGTDALDWVIAGGESGPGARPCDVAWLRSIVAQCRAASVSCFVKQLGARTIFDRDELPDESKARYYEAIGGFTSRQFEVRLRDRKGGSMDEWPEDLRIREFPEVRP